MRDHLMGHVAPLDASGLQDDNPFALEKECQFDMRWPRRVLDAAAERRAARMASYAALSEFEGEHAYPGNPEARWAGEDEWRVAQRIDAQLAAEQRPAMKRTEGCRRIADEPQALGAFEELLPPKQEAGLGSQKAYGQSSSCVNGLVRSNDEIAPPVAGFRPLEAGDKFVDRKNNLIELLSISNGIVSYKTPSAYMGIPEPQARMFIQSGTWKRIPPEGTSE